MDLIKLKRRGNLVKTKLTLSDLDVVYRTKESKRKSSLKLVLTSDLDTSNKELVNDLIQLEEGGTYEVTLTRK